MRKMILKQTLLLLCLMMAIPFASAQVRVGDILCEGDEVVRLADYDTASYRAIGVVFHVDASGKHGWAVAMNDLGEYAWGPNSKDTRLRNLTSKQQAAGDLDGQSNTRTILNHGLDIEFPAFDSLDFQNGWYLPAIGQLKRLYNNLDKVNESLTAAGGTALSDDIHAEYWSSTEYSVCNAWTIDAYGELHFKDNTFNGNKDGRRHVRGSKNF